MACFGMQNWYGMMGFNYLGILFEGIFLLVLILVLVLLIKEKGRLYGKY